MYTWIVAVGGVSAFAMAWGIGANDLANAFGTAYGAGVLTLKQIVLVASVCEFGGALLLGREVTQTIGSSVVNVASFSAAPYVFMYGMLCALVASTSWVAAATYWELPVSTTHSIIGGVIGFGMTYAGPSAITWFAPKDEFPYMKGVVPIVVSWFTSPILAMLASMAVFWATRTVILRHEQSLERAYKLLPGIVAFTFWANAFFVIAKGAKSEIKWPIGQVAWVATCIAGGTGLTSRALMPLLKRRVDQDYNNALEGGGPTRVMPVGEKEAAKEAAAADSPSSHNAHDTHDDVVQAIHTGTEVFDVKTERCFNYVQVFTSICASFAHGANDVANSVGPFAAIWSIYQSGQASSTIADVPTWVIAMGGGGIVVGLSTYGTSILKVLGVKMTKLTPSRGYAAELATAIVVMLASSYGLPISTTHCITGAVIGVGLVEGPKQINWSLAARAFSGWVLTLVVTAVLTSALFAQGVYAPSA